MAELKTKKTAQSVTAFLDSIPDEKRRADCYTVVDLMRQATGAEPAMWGEAIIGFGSLHYKYASGREGDWFVVGLSPRKQNLTLYINVGFDENRELLGRLGKHKTGRSCLYINRLADVDLEVLEGLITRAAQQAKAG